MKTREKIFNKKIKILLFLITLVVIVLLIRFAYAKYMTQLNGDASADIARFNFNVKAGSSDELIIDLGKTRGEVEQVANVQTDYIGPGTAGKFAIIINATNSETSLEYEINMDVDYQNNNVFPKNLIFYYDEEMKNAIYHNDNKININGYIPYSESNKVQTKTIYWKWDYETGQTQNEKDANDIADSEWMGKDITLSINVVGKQVNTNPTINQCAVTFDANGGIIEGYGNSEKMTKTLICNQEYGTLPTPKKVGYKFAGWSTNLANEISTESYDADHYRELTSSEIKYDGEIEELTNQSYIHVTANSDISVDTRWYICSKEFFKVESGKKYNLSFYVRSQNALTSQYINAYIDAVNKGLTSWFYILWGSGNKTYIPSSTTFANDGQWHYIEYEIIVPDGEEYAKIYLGNDQPNLYGIGAYIDISNLQLYNPDWIIQNVTEDTVVMIPQNHTLTAIWIRE